MSVNWDHEALLQSGAMARRIMEKSLQMRCTAYLSDVKSKLLQATLMELEGSKRRVLEQTHLVEWQRVELSHLRDDLERRVVKRTEELEASNVQLRHEVEQNRLAKIELERLHRGFVQAQKMELVGQLAGGVAHDFNNFLSVILCSVELAIMRSEGGQVPVSALDEVSAAVSGAAAVASQLLMFSGQRVSKCTGVNLNTLFSRLSSMFLRILGEQIALEVCVEDPGPVWVDETHLEQALVNLLVNARDAIDGAGVVGLRAARCRVDRDGRRADFIRLSVSDDGCGMSESTLVKATEGFFTTKKEGQGTGLGLLMVNEVMERMGGRLSLSSELGVGTEVCLLLPISTQPVSARREPLAAKRGDERILVIDDDPAVCRVLKETLTFLGYEVWCLSSALGILSWLERQPVHLILSDIQLPQMSGHELVSLLAARRPEQALLLMSGCATELERYAPCMCLSKPLTVQAVSSAIRATLDA